MADEDTVRFLKQVQLFRRLPADQIPALASCSKEVAFESGQTVIRQGDEGDAFFIIKTGTANVEVDGKKEATLRSGDYFGESALLRDEPRTATIVAASTITALKITREQFQRLGLKEKLDFAKRGAFGGGNNKEVKVKPPSHKSHEERKLMHAALKSNANLTTVVDLNEQQLNEMIDVAWKESVPGGTELIKQNDLEADYLYIVQTGSFEVLISGQEEGKSAEQAAASVATISPGGSFGELALLYFAPRAATVKAKEESVVWVIDRKNFKTILAKKSDDIVHKYVQYLHKVDILSSLKDDERLEVAKALLEMSFHKDEVVMQQGEKGEIFYILITGDVSVIKDGKQETTLSGNAASPSFFGEMALLNSEPRTATIKVTSESARALTLDRASFDMLLGPLGEIKARGLGGASKVGHVALTSVDPNKKVGHIKRQDLKRLGLLGCGGFGAVEMVEHVGTGDTYALKALSKGYIVKSGMQASVMSEKTVQMLCDSPFIVKLYETYNGDQSLYLLLELALGGELYATYHKKDLFGKAPHAKYYIAGVVHAFDHMHHKKIIFRDLKPENVLLNEAGHVKVTDMGLAKVCVGKTYTTCGTPDYFAPELIQATGHTRALDWWTLGILTFELMAGNPPFESASPMQIYQKVVKGIGKVNFPRSVKGTAEDLVKALCKADPSERLPMKKGGILNIQQHLWYHGFDWGAMGKLTLPPPYKPHVRNKKDITNFSARKEDMPPQIPYKDPGTGWDKNFATST